MALVILLFAEIGIGMLNVLLLAPVWLQILHLLVADSIWISLVLASAAVVLEDPFARLGHADHELEAIADPAQHMGIGLQNLLSR